METIPYSVAYWREIWLETLQRANHIDPGIEFSAPAFVLNDLAEELRLTRLERPGARDGYLTLLKESCGRPLVKKHYDAQLRAVREAVAQWKGWQFALHQTEHAIKYFAATYGSHAADYLVTLINQDPLTATGRLQLAALTNDMVVSLLVDGHSDEFIAGIPRALLDGHRMHHGHAVTSFPHGVDNESGGTAFAARVVAFMGALTYPDRLRRVSYYFERHSSKSRYVFQLRGLNIETATDLGDATIYDARVTPKISFVKGPFAFDETFGQDTFPNIGVLIEHDPRDGDATRLLAEKRAGQYLDLLKPFVDSTSTMRVVTDQHLITDEEWGFRGHSSSSAEDEQFVQMTTAPQFAADLNDQPLLRFAVGPGAKAIINSQDGEGRRLAKALHVSRRGEETKRHDDKLTSHWIAIETLLALDDWRAGGAVTDKDSILALAIRVLPTLLVRRSHIYSVGWRLHGALRWHHRRGLVVSPALQERCQLVPDKGQTLHLRQIVDALPKLALELSEQEQPRLLEQIQETIKFYGNPVFAHEAIMQTIKQHGSTLQKLYRARNRVVHDAVRDGPLFETLAEYASELSAALLKQAIHSFGQGQRLTHSLIELEAEVERLLLRLQMSQPVDLLALPAMNDAWG